METEDPAPLQDPEVLREAAQLMGQAFAQANPVVADPEVFTTVGLLHYARYRMLPSAQVGDDLRATLALFGMVQEEFPERIPPLIRTLLASADEAIQGQRAAVFGEAAMVEIRAFESGGDLGRLDAAIAHFAEAASVLPTGHPELPGTLCDLGQAWRIRGEHRGDPNDSDKAVQVYRDALAAAPGDGPDRSACLSGLATALSARHEITRSPADIAEGVRAARASVQSAPDTDPGLPLYCSRLGILLENSFEHSGDQTDLDEAVKAHRNGLELAPAGHPDRALLLANMASTLRIYSQSSGRAEMLDESIAVGREALELTPPGHENLAHRLRTLANALLLRYDNTGQAADLTEGRNLLRQALDTPRVDAAELVKIRLSWCTCLLRQAAGTRRMADNDAVIDAFHDMRETIPNGHPDMGTLLSGLAGALLLRFERAGRPDDLDKAIETARQAVEVGPAAVPDAGGLFANLQTALVLRYLRTGQRADLEDAVGLARRAASVGAPDEVGRVTITSNLANVLRLRYMEFGEEADLREAIHFARRAMDECPPGSPLRTRLIAEFASALIVRSALPGQEADREEALRICREASAGLTEDDPYHADLLDVMSAALSRARSSRGEELDELIEPRRQQVAALSPDDTDRGKALFGLGAVLQMRFDRVADDRDLTEAAESFQAAAEIPFTDVHGRMLAAVRCAQISERLGRHDAELRAFTLAVSLLPLVAWHGVDQATQERRLSEWAGLAADAAACAIELGLPEKAVELLEQGRSVLADRSLQIRGDLSELESAAPELAARMALVRNLLDTAEPEVGGLPIAVAPSYPHVTDTSSSIAGRHRDERARLAAEWDDLLTRARSIPGLENFLAPTRFTEFTEAAADGPAILVNVSRRRCDALVVTSEGVSVVPLPNLTAELILQFCEGFVSTVRYSPAMGLAGTIAMRGNVQSAMKFLWRYAAEPVLRFLGHLGPPPEGRSKPRVWWCPVGPLAFLPLHAAGDHGADSPAPGAVIDRVISSYTPTLSALIRSRNQAGAAKRRVSALAVALPETPGLRALPHAEEEAGIVARYLAPLAEVAQLIGPQATRANVRAALEDHDWVHFACHGRQDMDDPGNGGIELWDGTRLTVRDIAAARPRRGGLAYLSACDTAVGGIGLIDEAMHLAGALNLAGYRNVIASLWAVSDRDSSAVAERVYQVLAGEGRLGVNDTAAALDAAVVWLHDRYPDQPEIWAPYIHIGA
ncbi:CHAT domain-containing protein [Actinomadura decatromicini]|uniref:CHAT domain-containing protein n=1 Tax=Actinomadura decatromicini TaxID=2604572 RepID=UPI001652D4D5|nr:CHAT domain-containing protein [Actinomadura decatromicini]